MRMTKIMLSMAVKSLMCLIQRAPPGFCFFDGSPIVILNKGLMGSKLPGLFEGLGNTIFFRQKFSINAWLDTQKVWHKKAGAVG